MPDAMGAAGVGRKGRQMANISELNRSMRGITLTNEDEVAFYVAALGESHEYSNSIADRNDAAIMQARTLLAHTGCKATRNRAMPVG